MANRAVLRSVFLFTTICLVLSTLCLFFIVAKGPQSVPLNLLRGGKETVDTLQLAAIGDVLLHKNLYNASKTDDGYDFKSRLG